MQSTRGNFRDCASRETKAGFTLIELMAVVTIIGLMLLVALPALNSISGGSQLTNAARQFNNALMGARQAAISQNRRTRVCILVDSSISSGDAADVKMMQFSAYAIMAQGTISTNLATSGNSMSKLPWQYLQSWRFLPKGVIFDPCTTTVTANDANNTKVEGSTLFTSTEVTSSDHYFPDDSSKAYRRMYFIEFRPTGAAAKSLSIRLIPNATVDQSGSIGTIKVQGRTSFRTIGGADEPCRKNCIVLSWDDILGKVKWIQPGA